MSARRPPGYMTEDLELRIVGGPPRYSSLAGKPVRHVALATREGNVIGYLYVNDEEDAAGWVAIAGLSPEGWNLATPWVRRLGEGKRRGLKPSVALEELLSASNPYTRIVEGSLAESASLSALRTTAGHPEAET